MMLEHFQNVWIDWQMRIRGFTTGNTGITGNELGKNFVFPVCSEIPVVEFSRHTIEIRSRAISTKYYNEKVTIE